MAVSNVVVDHMKKEHCARSLGMSDELIIYTTDLSMKNWNWNDVLEMPERALLTTALITQGRSGQ